MQPIVWDWDTTKSVSASLIILLLLLCQLLLTWAKAAEPLLVFA